MKEKSAFSSWHLNLSDFSAAESLSKKNDQKKMHIYTHVYQQWILSDDDANENDERVTA